MKASYRFLFFCAILVVLAMQSCGVNSNLMFKEAKGEVTYNSDSIPMFPTEDYKISPDDKITFTLSTNDGTQILERMSGISKENGNQTVASTEFVVRRNGYVELPVIGKVKAAGNTVEAFEDSLVVYYSKEYKRPFVQVRITNQRVIVFPGNGSDATVVPLLNTNTTLMEALAHAGGITDRGKANTIKLMRLVNGERKVYGIDLSTMEGLKHVDMIVQANDYIYVEPTAEIAKEVAQDVVPIISLLSSALFIVSAVNLLK